MASQPERVTMISLMERLRRMYEGIGNAKAVELRQTDFVVRHLLSPDGAPVGTAFTFELEEEAPGIAENAIHVTAVFQNYCFTYAKEHGISVTEVNKVANDCNEIWIIRDLDNNSKHPETDNNRSKLFPRLRNIRPTMHLGAGPMDFQVIPGRMFAVQTNGASRGVTAEIVNSETGEVIGELISTLNAVVSAWEMFLGKHNII